MSWAFLRPFVPYVIMGGLAAGGWAWMQHQGRVIDRLKGEVATAQEQAALNANATRSVDRYTREVRIIEKKGQEAQNEVRQAPGASDDFAVRDELCHALAGMRDSEPACIDPDPPDLP